MKITVSKADTIKKKYPIWFNAIRSPEKLEM